MHIPDAPTPAEESVIFSASIVDDSTWHYSNWTYTGGPSANAVQNLGTKDYSTGFDPPVTEHGFLITEWRQLGQFTDTSDEFGDSAHFEGSITWNDSKTWGWNIGGSASGKIDLSEVIDLPVELSGSVNGGYTFSTTTGTGGSRTVTGTDSGAPNKKKFIAAYGEYKYLYIIRTYGGDWTLPDIGVIHTPVEVSYPRVELGWTGEINTSYKAEMSRTWFDPENSSTAALSLLTYSPNAPATIGPTLPT